MNIIILTSFRCPVDLPIYSALYTPRTYESGSPIDRGCQVPETGKAQTPGNIMAIAAKTPNRASLSESLCPRRALAIILILISRKAHKGPLSFVVVFVMVMEHGDGRPPTVERPSRQLFRRSVIQLGWTLM